MEVKSGKRKSEKGLNKFCEYYPDAKKVFITPDNYLQLEKEGLSFFDKL